MSFEGLKTKKYLPSRRKRFDPTALIASLGGLLALLIGVSQEGSFSSFVDGKSLLIVVGGTLASILFQFDFLTCWHSLSLTLRSLLGTPDKGIQLVLQQLDTAIIENTRLIELRSGDEIDGEILNDIVFMYRQGLLYEEIDEFVSSRIADEYLGRRAAVEVLRKASIVAPSLGLFGTVIGLIGVLRSLSNPAEIGSSMSLALMTTAYGAALSSLVFTPLAGRLDHHNTIYLSAHEQLLNKISILLKREDRNFGSQFQPEGLRA
jgi:chemotaxis protein MotA